MNAVVLFTTQITTFLIKLASYINRNLSVFTTTCQSKSLIKKEIEFGKNMKWNLV